MTTTANGIGDAIRASGAGRMCLTGNEAIVRGALEAGIGFVSGYPGTPASEIGDIFRDVSAHFGIRYEDSVNEKVAVETAFAAALLGVRSLAAMKHLGLASAGDPAGTIPYIGTHGGFVIVSGGDPGLIVSPNEQDQRYAARMMQMPVFDPATPGHALEMTRFAFSFSEQTRLPVLIRTTIQVNFARGVVETRPLPGAPSRLPFEKNPGGHVPIPSNARRMRRELADRIRLAESLLTGSPLFTRTGSGPLGIVTSGVSVNYVLDAIEEMGLEDAVQVLHLGCVYPVPAEVMEGMFASCERLLVVEELLPFVEETLKSAAHEQGYTGRIDGKSSGHIPESFALDPDIVRAAVKDFVAGTTPSIAATNDEPAGANDPAASGELAPRPPVLCAGCSHRSAFLAVRMVLGEESIYCNDIGCYTLGYGAPLDSADMVLSMGSSIAMASSASRLGHQNPVAYIGDSTFFHSGLPALANAVRNEDNIIVVVMDNRIVAMTGHQSSFSERSPAGEPELSIADVCRSMGAKVWVANPDRLPDVVPLIERIADESGVRVLVTEETCPLDAFRKGTLKKEKVYRIDRTLCRHCGHEARSLYCATAVPRRYQETAALSRVRSMLPADDAAQPSAGAAASRAACGVLGAHDGAPCAQACPVDICIQGYVGRAAAGDFAAALAQVRQRNPLPVISSYVCHRPCEDACVHAPTGAAVEINRVKEFLVNWERDRTAGDEDSSETEWGAERPILPGTPHGRVAVVGAGPAGLACASELVGRGYDATVFDAHDRPGGMLEQGIPANRLPRDMLAHEIDAIRKSGVRFEPGWKLGTDGSLADLFDDGFEAVCIALGAHKASDTRGIELVTDDGAPVQAPNAEEFAHPGEAPVAGALDFLKGVNSGHISNCGRNVVVVGGGDCALDTVRTSFRLGAETVTLLYRRGFDDMPARADEIEDALSEGARIICHGQPASICLGGDGVEKVVVQRTREGDPDASGRRRPEPIPGSFFDLAADSVLLATGEDPDTAGILGNDGIALKSDGTVVTDAESGRTKRAGVFAAGDVAGVQRTVLDAIASGKRAAWGIDTYLSDGRREVFPHDTVPSVKGKATGVTTHRCVEHETIQLDNGDVEAIVGASPTRPAGFEREKAAMSEAEARKAASACLICGACGECSACLDLFGCPAMYVHDGKVAIDEELCTGCSVCAQFCPNGAIIEVSLG